VGFNSRLCWNLRSGQDIWFLLSHGMNDLDEDGDFSDVQTSATFEFRYTCAISTFISVPQQSDTDYLFRGYYSDKAI
jgi:hypothetical protein